MSDSACILCHDGWGVAWLSHVAWMHPAKLRCLLDAPPSTPTTASKFRVLYDDNSKDAVHSLSETAVCIQQDAGERGF